MDFYMDKDQRLQRAQALEAVSARTLEGDSDVQVTGSNSIDVMFQAKDDASLLKEMFVAGRSVITMSAPKSKANDPRAANKRLTANAVKLIWRITGRDLERAEATGDAELFVDPVVQNANAERKTLTAVSFDCDFFEAGNLARTCKGDRRIESCSRSSAAGKGSRYANDDLAKHGRSLFERYAGRRTRRCPGRREV